MSDKLAEIREEHKHDADRTLVQDVVPDRKILTCHDCQDYIAENRNDGNGWRWV